MKIFSFFAYFKVISSTQIKEILVFLYDSKALTDFFHLCTSN